VSDEEQTDANEVATDEAPGAPDEPIDGQWLEAADLARMIGLSAKAVTALGAQGELRRKRTTANRPWFYLVPRSLRAEREDLVTELRRLLKDSQQATRDAYALVKDPAFKMLELFSSTNSTLQEGLKSMQDAQVGYIKAREEALSEAHVRKLMTDEDARKGARWDAVFKTLGETVPPIVAQAVETWFEAKGPTGFDAITLVREFGEALAGLDLTEEQAVKLRKVLKVEEPAEPHTNGSSNGAS
jgi:hypothetical protein